MVQIIMVLLVTVHIMWCKIYFTLLVALYRARKLPVLTSSKSKYG